MADETLIDERITVRKDHKGEFDELFLMDGSHCVIHAEMMDSGCLWIGIYPTNPPHEHDRVSMWIRAKGRKLNVNAFAD